MEACTQIDLRTKRRVLALGAAAVVLSSTLRAAAPGPFATEVIEYSSAPGQFVNQDAFNDPTVALGPPTGAGTSAPSNASVVTLGGFGGFIVLGFDHRIENDRRNAYGMDAIVYGNAFWVGGNAQRHWAECVTIEISLDENQNGVADDPWYLIPGSHILDPQSAASAMTWDDDIADLQYPPAQESWIPPGVSGEWTTEGYLLPAPLFGATVVANPSTNPLQEGIVGYGDYFPTLLLGDTNGDNLVDAPTATPEDFYTWPDDPFTVGVSPQSGGGDAFDIAWAEDPTTGEPADLPGFDFIRLTTAVAFVSPTFGEKSGEIDAVADVRPDPFGDADQDDDIDLLDVAALQECFSLSAGEVGCERFDTAEDHHIGDDIVALLIARITGPR
jgi:hypothetical protein